MLDSIKHFYWNLKEDTPVLRCVFGVTLALIFSTTLGYSIPHTTAIFALMFLAPSKKPLGIKTEVGLVLGLSILGYIGIIFSEHLIDYPLVIIPLLGLTIYWSFRLVKIPEPIRLLFLILVVLLPFVSLKANVLGSIVLTSLLLNLTVALGVVRVAFLIFPFTNQEDVSAEQKKPIAYKNINLDQLAFNALVVVLPLVSLFYLFNATIAVLTLVFVVILSFDPFIYQSKKGAVLLFANIMGGLAGIIVYNILVIAPSYVLYIFVIMSVAFYFVLNLYSGKKIAPVFKISFNTFFVIMGVISTSTNEAGNTIWERVIQIGLAIIYVIVAFKIINTFNNPKTVNAE